MRADTCGVESLAVVADTRRFELDLVNGRENPNSFDLEVVEVNLDLVLDCFVLLAFGSTEVLCCRTQAQRISVG